VLFRFRINLSLVVDADSAEEALRLASKLVPKDVPAESLRLTVQGDLYSHGVRAPRHKDDNGRHGPVKARARG
jgi:hypothetical protein